VVVSLSSCNIFNFISFQRILVHFLVETRRRHWCNMRVGTNVSGSNTRVQQSARRVVVMAVNGNKKSPCPKCPRNNCRDCPTKRRKAVVGGVQEKKTTESVPEAVAGP